MIDRGSGCLWRMARWLAIHSRYAVTATTAPNTMSGTPSMCRPHGTPGNGGSSWTTPSPATTSASAVRLQARKVRSFGKREPGVGLGAVVVRWLLAGVGHRAPADYEATQQQMFDGSNTFTVPTTAERTGDFSNMGFTIYDPTLPDNPDGTRQPVAGNIITNPNPTALKFLSEFPKCNFPSASTCDSATTDAVPNLYVPGLDPTTQQKFDIRIESGWAGPG